MRSWWQAPFSFAAFAVAFSFAFAAAGVVLGQAPIRLGAEFQVNSYTVGHQRRPAVASASNGSFVVVWTSLEQDGDAEGVFARRFSPAGVALASEFQVHSYTSGINSYEAIAMEADGDFLVVWSSGSQQIGGGVFARRFDSAGVAQATEFSVNAYVTNSQDSPDVAARSDGGFVAVWQSNLQDGDARGVFGRRFDSAGVALAFEFQVSLYTIGYQSQPTVTTNQNGDFVVAWNSKAQDGDLEGVFARRFDSTGAPQALEFQVTTYTMGAQYLPDAATMPTGGFVIVWNSFGQDGSYNGIFARRFDSAGVPLATELQVNSRTSSGQSKPAVTRTSDGGFVVAWNSNTQDGADYGVFARRFSSSGTPQGADFQVNVYTPAYQQDPDVAALPGGGFIVAWFGYAQDGADTGVFAQRFATAVTLDVDGNGSTGALTDGLLVLRFMFGFTGTTLTGGAVGAGCSRCDAAAIVPYLTGLGMTLDIDGNGALGALTDGLLVLRFLFGFTGTTLTGGAVAGNCTRCDAAAITPYEQGLV